jgi:BASS family bile acid:Na+ symporter
VAVLDIALWACVVVFVVGSLAGVGLGLSARDALAPLSNRRFVTLTLVVSWLVCPAIAYGLLLVVPLEQHYAIGLVLMALAPCAPYVPAMVQKAKGDLAYMAAFVILSTVATVVVMPMAVPALVGLSVGPWSIAQPLLLFVVVPLVLGMVVRTRHPHAAERARSPIAGVTNIAGGVLLLLMPVMYGRGVLDAIGSFAIVTQVAFIGLVTVAAERLGSSLPDDQQSVLTLGVCTRNLGAALAPLAAIDPDPRTVVMIAIGGPVTVILSWFTARWLARSRDRQAAAHLVRAAH